MIAATLVSFGLRQLLGRAQEKAEAAVPRVIQFVKERFSDQSQALPQAIAAAQERAWRALGIALAGDSLWDLVKSYAFDDATERGVRVRLQPFLRAAALDALPAAFRKACLTELKSLRDSGALKASQLQGNELARQTAAWQVYGDPAGLVQGAKDAVARLADSLANDYPNLSQLLRQPAGDGPPLLAALFAFFLDQTVAKNKDLAAALSFDLLHSLYAAQERAFAELNEALDVLGEKLDAIISKLVLIEDVVVETLDVVIETQAAVLSLQAALERNNSDEVRILLVQVIERLDKQGMQRGVLRPGDSSSMQSDEERAAVRALKQRFRQLPPELQRQVPALLNGLGKLEHSAGDFAAARTTFAAAARIAPGETARAEVFFNDYRSALELRDYDGAFSASQQAAALDPMRFALFPSDRYTPQRILGAGGFGAAFLCHDENFERLVVVKTLHTQDHLERAVSTVFNEAHALTGLSHPAIIKVYDGDFAFKNAASKRKERPYIVMEYFPGVSLKTYVEKNGELKPQEYLMVAKQIASGMSAAHRQGVWHRDLKPDNLLIQREGDRFVVKIIDFGLALRRSVVETSVAKKRESTVLGDSAAGTRRYSAPEQMDPQLGLQSGPHSDVYAFGKTSWFALFQTTMPRETQKQSVPALAALLDKCTKEHPEDRHPNFEAVGAQLDGGAEQRKPRSVNLKPPSPLPSPAAPVKNFTNTFGMQFVFAPAATCWIGKRKQQRQFTLSQPLYLGVHPVTQGQWQSLMGNNPSWFSRTRVGADKVREISDADLKLFPIECVSWEDVQSFIERLNAREQNPKWLYRLPTKVEWEYFCRGGTTSKTDSSFDFFFDKLTNDASSLQANFDGNYPVGNGVKGLYLERTTKVGSYKSNRLGVFDMHGNVWEWCDDRSGASERIIRGGSWRSDGEKCRASERNSEELSSRRNDLGFRLARVPSGQ